MPRSLAQRISCLLYTSTVEIAPVVEEVMKLLPLMFYLFVFEPKPDEIDVYKRQEYGRDLVAASPAFCCQYRCVDNVDVVGAVFAAKCPPDLCFTAASRPDEKRDTRSAFKVVVDDHGRGPAGCVLANDPADVGVQPSFNVCLLYTSLTSIPSLDLAAHSIFTSALVCKRFAHVFLLIYQTF